MSPPISNKSDEQVKSIQPTLTTTFPTKYCGAKVLIFLTKNPYSPPLKKYLSTSQDSTRHSYCSDQMLNFRRHFCNLTLARTSQQSSCLPPLFFFFFLNPLVAGGITCALHYSSGRLALLEPLAHTLLDAVLAGREQEEGAGPTNLIWQKISHSCKQCAGSM